MPERVYDGATCEHVSPGEYARRQAERRELEFQHRARQGELACPMVISDSMGTHGLRSQVDGRQYDSKSAMRRHYREAGVVEVGNDGPLRRGPKPEPDRQGNLDAAERSLRAVGFTD